MLKVKKIQKETKQQNQKISDQTNYLKGRVETMTNERKETNESVHKLERQQLCMQHEIEDLECQLQDNMKIVESFDSKQYNTDIGKCILQLQSLDLPCDKMGQIIQTVSENIKVDILKIPCRTTIH